MSSLREIGEKGKSPYVYIAAAIILVGFGSFGLGRLSMRLNTAPDVVLQEVSESSPDTFLVGSKTGKAYYLPWCGGARSISEENKVWFKSEAEAKAAGYAPAQNCKGL